MHIDPDRATARVVLIADRDQILCVPWLTAPRERKNMTHPSSPTELNRELKVHSLSCVRDHRARVCFPLRPAPSSTGGARPKIQLIVVDVSTIKRDGLSSLNMYVELYTYM